MEKAERHSVLTNGAVLLVMGLAMLLLNLCTFVYSDDYPYAFYLHTDGLIDRARPIGGIVDILQSQYHHYFLANGRLFANGLVQWFMFLDNRFVFGICNTFIFIGYVLFLQKVSERRGRNYSLLIMTLLLVLLRAFGETQLWMSGALNYLWAGFMNLVFLYCMRCCKDSSWLKTYGLLLPLSLLAGWWQEVFSVSIGMALLTRILYRWYRGQKWERIPLMMSVAYLVGTLLLVLAPGTIDRMGRDGMDTGYMLSHLGKNILYVLMALRITWFALVIAVVRHFRKQQSLGEFYRQNRFLLVAIMTGILFLMLLGRVAQPRAFFGVETLAILLVLRQLSPWPKAISTLLALVSLGVYVFVLQISWKNYQTMQAFRKEVMKPGENIFFDLPHYSAAQAHYLGSLLELNHHSGCFPLEASYYHKPMLRVLPRRLYQELYLSTSFLAPQNEWQPGEYSSSEMTFSVVPLPADQPLPPSTEESESVSFPSGKYILKDKPHVRRKRMAKRKDK